MKLTLNRYLHLIFYLTSLFIIVSVLLMPLEAWEKVIHSFAWIYLVLLYAYFFDENPPKFLRVELLYGTATEEYYNEFFEKLLSLSQYSLSLMRKIQLHEDYQEVNQSISELEQKYHEIKQLNPPAKYADRHQAIVEDIRVFLDGLKDGDYYIGPHRTTLDRTK
jgi:hypothetical protein